MKNDYIFQVLKRNLLNKYRIKYKRNCGYYVQYRNWETFWVWVDVVKENSKIAYYADLKYAHEVVKDLASQEAKERTVYLFRGI